MSPARNREPIVPAKPSWIGAGEPGGSSSVPADPVLTLEPSRVLRVLLSIAAVLVLVSIAGQAVVNYSPDLPLRDSLANLFSVEFEQSIPTLYSTLLIMASALLLGLIAHARVEPRRYWFALCVLFFMLAVDEFAGLHEQATDRVQSLLDVSGGDFLATWVIPGIAITAVTGLAFVPLLRRIPRSTRRGFVLAASMFVGGAIGIEIVGSAYVDANDGVRDMPYAFIVSVEEGLEMVGIVVFIHSLIAYMAACLPNTAWRLRVMKYEKRI